MLVTINTDASFHPKLKYGAFAFWAICNDFKITKSGVFRTKCISTDDAEAKCIINSLKVILLAHSGISKVIVNTDSLNAIAILTNDKTHINRYAGYNKPQWGKLRKIYHETKNAGKSKPIIEFRHVKAHSGTNDARSYVNEWCDAEAKKQLRRKTQ